MLLERAVHVWGLGVGGVGALMTLVACRCSCDGVNDVHGPLTFVGVGGGVNHVHGLLLQHISAWVGGGWGCVNNVRGPLTYVGGWVQLRTLLRSSAYSPAVEFETH